MLRCRLRELPVGASNWLPYHSALHQCHRCKQMQELTLHLHVRPWPPYEAKTLPFQYPLANHHRSHIMLPAQIGHLYCPFQLPCDKVPRQGKSLELRRGLCDKAAQVEIVGLHR